MTCIIENAIMVMDYHLELVIKVSLLVVEPVYGLILFKTYLNEKNTKNIFISEQL